MGAAHRPLRPARILLHSTRTCVMYDSKIPGKIMHDTLEYVLGHLEGPSVTRKRPFRGISGAMSVFSIYYRVGVAFVIYFRVECKYFFNSRQCLIFYGVYAAFFTLVSPKGNVLPS